VDGWGTASDGEDEAWANKLVDEAKAAAIGDK
jgi:hypothetical protein